MLSCKEVLLRIAEERFGVEVRVEGVEPEQVAQRLSTVTQIAWIAGKSGAETLHNSEWLTKDYRMRQFLLQASNKV